MLDVALLAKLPEGARVFVYEGDQRLTGRVALNQDRFGCGLDRVAVDMRDEPRGPFVYNREDVEPIDAEVSNTIDLGRVVL